jgi:hypothetical protein|tara:strand:- start:1560 stop:2183 length:624 start_codon:yes stop_codon:yes gene_type:complete
MRDNMKDLTNKIQNLGDRRFWDEFIPVFNDYLDHRLRVENKFSIKKYNCIKEYYDGSGSNQSTQDFTKGVAGTFESIIELIATNHAMDYFACASDGFDGIDVGIEKEFKLTMGLGNSWTGNKKSVKVPNHLLVKMEVENNKISKLGVYEANLDECEDSSWYNNGDGKKGNYTTLRFHKNDIDNVSCIYGNLIPKLKWCGVELEEITY